MANFRYSHLYNSSASTAPNATDLNIAEIALTTLAGSEALWFKNSDEQVIKVGVGVSYTKEESDKLYVTTAKYETGDTKSEIVLKNAADEPLATIDATPFLGMLEKVTFNAGTLTFEWNEAADKDKIDIELDKYFATKEELNTAKTELKGEINGVKTKLEGDIEVVNDLLTGVSESLSALADDVVELQNKDFVEYTTFDGGRKTIQLGNYDSISGLMTNDPATDGFKPDKAGGVNLVMVSKWNVADFGSTQLPINLNGSEDRPKYNDKNDIALLSDVTDASKAATDALTAHTSNEDIHVTTDDKENWDGKADLTYVNDELEKKADIEYVDNTFFADVVYDSTAKTITFYAADETVLGTVKTDDFVKDGMVDKVEITGETGEKVLVITFNTDSGKEEVKLALTDIFDASNYYNKDEVDAELAKKADTATTYAKTEVDDLIEAVSGAVDTLSEEVDGISEQVDTNTGDIAQNASDIDGLDERVTENETNIADNTSKINTISDKVEANGIAIGELNKKVITAGTSDYVSNNLKLTLVKDGAANVVVDMPVVNQGGVLIANNAGDTIILSAGTFTTAAENDGDDNA